MLRKGIAALAALLVTAAYAVSASAVELTAGRIRAFQQNMLTVTSDDGGRLTIEVVNGTLSLENAVTDLWIPGGTLEIPWEALTYGGEPISPGTVTLRATLRGSDRTVEQTEITAEVGSPVPAALCCLPAAQRFYADGKSSLRIEAALSAAGNCEISISPRDNPDEVIWHDRQNIAGEEPGTFRWNGRDRKRQICPPGDYVISVWSRACPEQVKTAEITLTAEPLPEAKLTVTGSLIPENLNDDVAVWEALTAPVAVGEGPEGQGLRIMKEKGSRSGVAGTVACRTVGLAILETDDDGWVKVGAWRQGDGYYLEGYVKADKLTMIRPNTRYGAVVDKNAQRMTVYEAGRKIGTVAVSTGLTTAEDRKADTHSGVFLLGTRMEDFTQDGHVYCYPIRIDCFNLIHQIGFAREGAGRNFDEEIATLGSKASHGCIRVDARITEESNGINAWWIWTHMGHDTKIIVTPEE